MPPPFTIRAVCADDIPAMCAIYAPYVESSTATWACAPAELPDAAEWAPRWARCAARGLPWLVACDAASGAVVGYCVVGEFRGRAGWRNTCEHGIYTAPGWQRRGVGRALLAACVAGCAAAGVACLMAVVSVHPASGAGAASRALHAASGFEEVGYLRGAGSKLGLTLDCLLMCRYIAEEAAAAAAAEGGARAAAAQ